MNNIIFVKYWQFFILLDLVALFFVDKSSYLFFVYSLAICVLISIFFCKKEIRANVASFLIYTFIAIIIYYAHKSIIPGYIGLTGPEGGIGTDDCRYYAQIVGGAVPYEFNFDYFKTLPFSLFLRFCLPFTVYTPLNVVIFNILGLCFLPYIVSRVLLEFTKSPQISRYGFILMFLCPYTIYFGCIIMRDMWIASAVLLGILLFKQKKYLWLFFVTLFICIIRFGSIAFLALSILVLIKERFAMSNNVKNGNVKFLLLVLLLLFAFYLAFPFIAILSDGRLEEGVFRMSIVDYLKNDDENALIVKILNLPFPINFIMSSVFFFFLPFLRFEIYTLGVFNIGNLFGSILTPFFFFPLWKYLIQSVLLSWRKNDSKIKSIVLCAVLVALALGTISLQARHKTVLIPFMCMMIAYGKYNYRGDYKSISGLCAAMIILIELTYAVVLI